MQWIQDTLRSNHILKIKIFNRSKILKLNKCYSNHLHSPTLCIVFKSRRDDRDFFGEIVVLQTNKLNKKKEIYYIKIEN